MTRAGVQAKGLCHANQPAHGELLGHRQSGHRPLPQAGRGQVPDCEGAQQASHAPVLSP